jgi:PilZ domain
VGLSQPQFCNPGGEMDIERAEPTGRQQLTPLLEQYGQPGNRLEDEPASLKVRLLRWLFPEITRRRATRYSSPGLVAYYWTGGAPHCYDVANISATGLYLRTKERWAPETLIQMTLQKGRQGESSEGSAISVLSEVVRWGDDGTGFMFVLKDRAVLRDEVTPAEVLDRKTVEKFLKQIELAD